MTLDLTTITLGLLALSACGWAMRATLQRAEARGDAQSARNERDNAVTARRATEAERDAHRDRADRESAAREIAVAEAADVRRRWAESAQPGSVAADFDRKFSGR